MEPKTQLPPWHELYVRLLRLYPQPHRERFGESMEQTFADLLTARAVESKSLFPYILYLFTETLMGIFREKVRYSDVKMKDFFVVAGVPVMILMVPLVGMQFSDEVAWSPADFAFAGVLLFGTSFTIWLTIKKSSNLAYRIAMGLAAISGLLLIWMNLAVGLIGNEENPANLMYLAVLAVGIFGAGFVRFRAKGMAGTLVVAALVQCLIAVLTLVTGIHLATGESIVKIILLNGIFIALFALSALLFRHASYLQEPAMSKQ